jgi:hypothetical protein
MILLSAFGKALHGEAFRDPIAGLPRANVQHIHDEIDRTKGSLIANEALHLVCDLSDTNGSGPILMLVPLKAPAVDGSRRSKPQVQTAGNLDDANVLIDEPEIG